MSVIVTDMVMPSGCWYCEFGRRLDNASTMCNRKPFEPPVKDGDERPTYCPLKEMKKMCQKQKPVYDNGRYICPNCNRTLVSVTGPDDKGRLGLKFCINCGQAVKWE